MFFLTALIIKFWVFIKMKKSSNIWPKCAHIPKFIKVGKRVWAVDH